MANEKFQNYSIKSQNSGYPWLFSPYFSACSCSFSSLSLVFASPLRKKKKAFQRILLIRLSTISINILLYAPLVGMGMFFQAYGKLSFLGGSICSG